MTTIETQTEPVNDDGTGNQPPQENADIRQLREKAKRADQLEAENNRYKQKDQLRDAGLDLNDKQMKALNAAHEGESNPDAWKQTAIDLGFIQPEPETPPAEVQAHQQVQNAAVGSVNPGGLPAEDAYAQANSPQDVLRIARERGTLVADDIQ